ncbi:MOSC N-terminal beta barrel domain-containing protein [Blastococcus mobilis]|nr:MOSC domain-containing protein [Blastococcus mobilis]
MQPQEHAVGRVERIWIYPVRSLAGRELTDAEVSPGGLAGDRAWTVTGEDGSVIRPKEAPAMRDVAPSGDPTADAGRLAAVLGRPVRLQPTSGARPDVAPVHLVSRQAVERAAAGELPEGCSAEDPRANLLLTLDGDERAWVGRDLRVGEVLLRVTRTPKHCLGVYADVVAPGAVRTGDPVLLV